MITKPITIDHDRWYVQRVGRHWLLYNGPNHGAGPVKDFTSWEKMIDYVEEERRKQQQYGNDGI